MNEINLFTFIDQCRTKDRRHDFDPKLAPSYMLTLGLSNDNDALVICNEVNQWVFGMEPEMVYEYFMATIPQTRKWVKWPKKDKESEKKKKQILEVAKRHNISPTEAKKLLL